MQKVAAQHDPIQSECRDALLLCCRSTCCRENRQQNLICGAAKSDLQHITAGAFTYFAARQMLLELKYFNFSAANA
jgi:hypothetical protein